MAVRVRLDGRLIGVFDGSRTIGWTAQDEALAYVRALISVWKKTGSIARSWWD